MYKEKKEMPQYITGSNKNITSTYVWNNELKDYLNVVDGHGLLTNQEVTYNFEDLIKKKYNI